MKRARPAILLLLLGGCAGTPSPQPSPSAAAAAQGARSLAAAAAAAADVVAARQRPADRIQRILPIAKSALDKWKGAEREQHKPGALRAGRSSTTSTASVAAGGAEPRRPGGHAAGRLELRPAAARAQGRRQLGEVPARAGQRSAVVQGGAARPAHDRCAARRRIAQPPDRGSGSACRLRWQPDGVRGRGCHAGAAAASIRCGSGSKRGCAR
jgi:hypothetical protein